MHYSEPSTGLCTAGIRGATPRRREGCTWNSSSSLPTLGPALIVMGSVLLKISNEPNRKKVGDNRNTTEALSQ